MSKVRLYHVAAEWEMSSKELLSALESAGTKYKSHWIEIDSDDVRKLRTRLESVGFFEAEQVAEPAPENEVVTDEASTDAADSDAEAQTESADVTTEADATETVEAQAATDAKAVKSQAKDTAKADKTAKTDAKGKKSTAKPAKSTDRKGKDAKPRTDSRTDNTRTDRGKGRDKGRKDFDDRGPRGGRKDAKRGDKRERKPTGDRNIAATIAKSKRNAPDPAETGKPGASTKSARKPKQKTPKTTRTPTKARGNKGSGTREVTSYRTTETSFSLEDQVTDAGSEIIVRRTMQGAMSHGGGGSAARRRTATIREREHWRRKSKRKTRGRKFRKPKVTRPSEVEIKLPITMSELSAATGIKLQNLIGTLMKEGYMLSQNMVVPQEALLKVSHEYLVDIQIKKTDNLEDDLVEIEKQSEHIDDQNLEPRQPIVTIMGHVDHGKTSLLDYIRNTKAPVAGSEAGGITQHIGAYVAEHNGRPITFIDTPGHAAFTRMRSRGAKITDIVVLVVAADDGIKAQTKEAISHAKAAGVELIVALNKIDKDNADPDRAMEMLATEGLQPVEWGGTTEVIPTSAITGQGVDDLLEMIQSMADLHEYKANPEGAAYGYVIEGKKTKGRGIVATVLVKDGTLEKGDFIISGNSTGRVRMLFNEHGRPMKSAGPGVPVEILGLDDVPSPGDKFHAVGQDDAKTLQQQRQIAEERAQNMLAPVADSSNIFAEFEKQKATRIPIVVRADVQGTLEVLKAEVPALSNDEVVLEITQALVGNVTESDIFLAQAQGAVVIAFNVGVDPKANSLAKEQGVEIESFSVIYEMIDFLKQRIEDSLAPEIKENVLGILVCRATFKASRIGQVAGCYVDSGVVRRNAMGRLSRDEIVIWEGELDSVKRFKEDVPEVREGFECGVKLKNFNDVQVGDVIEVFELQQIKRTLPRD